MLKFDLHTHSKYSYDGTIKPKELVEIAQERGLDGIAVTDHNTITGGLKAKKFETEDFTVIVGSEIKTPQGEIMGLFLTEEIEARTPKEVMEAIKAQNGIVVLPHPFDKLRRGRFPPRKADLELVDCLEGYNARCIFQSYNRRSVDFANAHGLGLTAGSDAHLKSEIGNAGVKLLHDNVKEALLSKKVEIFGHASSPLTHLKTKFLSVWKKWKSG